MQLWFLWFLAHCILGWALFSDWQYQAGTTGNDYVYGLAIDSNGPVVVGSTAGDLYGTNQGEELSCLLSSLGFPGFPTFMWGMNSAEQAPKPLCGDLKGCYSKMAPRKVKPHARKICESFCEDFCFRESSRKRLSRLKIIVFKYV